MKQGQGLPGVKAELLALDALPGEDVLRPSVLLVELVSPGGLLSLVAPAACSLLRSQC